MKPVDLAAFVVFTAEADLPSRPPEYLLPATLEDWDPQ